MAGVKRKNIKGQVIQGERKWFVATHTMQCGHLSSYEQRMHVRDDKGNARLVVRCVHPECVKGRG